MAAAEPVKAAAEEVVTRAEIVTRAKVERPSFRYPVNIAPVGEVEPKVERTRQPDGTYIVTVTGRVYVWQRRKVDGKEVMLKDASYYEKSTGDEPSHDSNKETVSAEQLSPTGTIKRMLTSRTLGIPLWLWSVIAIGSLVIIWVLTSNALQPIIPYELN